MARGRKPTPNSILKLRGSRVARDDGQESQAHGAGLVGPPPPWLDAGARQVWEETSASLDLLKIGSRADRDALAAYCLSVELMKRAAANVNERGLVIHGPTGEYRNPQILTLKEAIGLVIKVASEFGMTPAARKRIHEVVHQRNDQLAEILRLTT